MLGWDFNIWRQIDPPRTPARRRKGFIAGWETNLEGNRWLEELVKKGEAEFLGGDGYPLSYKAQASVIAANLANGPPKPGDGPVTIGEDYVLPSGWTGDFDFDQAELAQCSPDEVLIIDVWDMN